MSSDPDRLVELATRPLANNAELQLAGRKELLRQIEAHFATNADLVEAADSLERADQSPRRRVYWFAFYLMNFLVLQAVIARHSEDQEAAAEMLTDVLEMDPLDHWALEQPGKDPVAAYGFGNYLYDQKRHQEATTAHMLIGRKALESGDATLALAHFMGAMDTPESLGEACHLLQAKADVNYWIGRAMKSLGRDMEANDRFARSAAETGDFSEMAVTAHSPLSYYRGLSLQELGRNSEAAELFSSFRIYAESKLTETACIDYFATSLPNLLVFEEDMQARRDAEMQLLIAMAYQGLGDTEAASAAHAKVFSFTNADQHAVNLFDKI